LLLRTYYPLSIAVLKLAAKSNMYLLSPNSCGQESGMASRILASGSLLGCHKEANQGSPGTLTWLLVGFNSLQADGLRASMYYQYWPKAIPSSCHVKTVAFFIKASIWEEMKRRRESTKKTKYTDQPFIT
jgi:hypothetical protein